MINNKNFNSIDLDKELLGITSTKLKPTESKMYFQQEDQCLSPNLSHNLQGKDSIYSRKITGITDNTKADSVLRNNKINSKQIRSFKKPNEADLESFQS